MPRMHDAWQSAPTTLTVLSNVSAGDAQMLLDKYANTGILPNFWF